MIGALFGVISVATQVAFGCVKLAFGASKLAYKASKGLAKGSWKLAKAGKKLGKRVIKTIKDSRIMARDNIPSPAVTSSHIFTKPSSAVNVIQKSRNVSKQKQDKEKPKSKFSFTKSYIFNKNKK